MTGGLARRRMGLGMAIMVAMTSVFCVLTACKTNDLKADPKVDIKTDANAMPRGDEMVVPGAFVEDRERPHMVSGFDFVGPLSCLPLPAGRRCIDRHDPLVEACLQKKGQLIRCDDCSVVCSRGLK